MTKLVRTMLASHLVIFGAGFYAGRATLADELDLYRSANESTASRVWRKVQQVAIGAVAIGSLGIFIRLSVRADKK
jgi:hypothetical protein